MQVIYDSGVKSIAIMTLLIEQNVCNNCYNRYFSFNELSTFSLVHLILSQDTLSLIYFLMRSMISLILSQPSFNLHAMHGYAFFSSLPFDASHITHFMLPFYALPI